MKREGGQPKKLARSNFGEWGGVGEVGDVCAAVHYVNAFQGHFSIQNRMHVEADRPPPVFACHSLVWYGYCKQQDVLRTRFDGAGSKLWQLSFSQRVGVAISLLPAVLRPVSDCLMP